MAILLTGGTGLLGANLARLLAGGGSPPRLLLRNLSDRRGLRGVEYEVARGDVMDPATLVSALRGIHTVFHLAGCPPVPMVAGRRRARLRVEGTRHLLEQARAAKVRRVVVVAGTAAAATGPLDAPGTEDGVPSGPSFPGAEVERSVVRLAREWSGGPEVVVACPSMAVGAHEPRPVMGALLLAVAFRAVPFYPSGGAHFVNAEDAAIGLNLLAERGRPGELYYLSGQNLTYRALLTQCAEECGRRPPLLPLPDLLALGAGQLRSVTRHLPASEWLSWGALLSVPAYVSHAKASRELGYAPRPLRLGIREAYGHLQAEGLLPRDRPLTPTGLVHSS